MSEESPTPNPPRGPRSSRLSVEVKSELHDLMSALLDERITDAQRLRLEQMVVADEGAAELCLAVMHLSCSLPVHVLLDEMTSGGSERDTQASVASLMHETLIVPGIRDVDVSDDDTELAESPPQPVAPVAKQLPATWLWGSAAVFLLGSSITIWTLLGNRQTKNIGFIAGQTSQQHADQNGEQKTVQGTTPDARQNTAQNVGQNAGQTIAREPAAPIPPAAISATVALDPKDSQLVSPGTKLSAGRLVQLSGGAIELTFASGAVAVVKGPACVEIIGQNTVFLHDGSMTAHVPFAARGFQVNSPGLSVIDRGTDFGVRTLANTGGSEAHVFGGSVDVLALNKAGRSISAPMRVVATQAFRHNSGDAGAPAAVAFAPESFSRDIASIRQTLNLHGTGAGLAPGAVDPNWQLFSSPAELNWKPQQALVIADTGYPDSQNSPDGMWISNGNGRKSVPAGTYVFRTSVDLTGFDPATVSVEATVTADDWVSDIRVNDVSTGLSTELAESHDRFVSSTLRIPNTCWRSGVNRVDVVVQNKAMDGDGVNAMGLQVRWSATGCPVVKR